MSIFTEETGGKNSSKKVAGLVMLAVCVSMAFLDQLTDKKLNPMVWSTLFSGGMIMTGAKLVKDLLQKK